ncbi:MAG: GDSL-type esterase/lipase family protein [Treponema sp.]|jgi:acyl-CoA thioesterase-1|nr:GDSL-type esterase/lipase family protein [Treponema sp.]
MKKNTYSLECIVLGLMAGFGLIGCNNETGSAAATGNETAKLVCFGNSLTAGFGATVPGEEDKTNSYPAYLQNKVTIPVINAGVSGDTTVTALNRIVRDVLSENPQVVIIELGANDLFQFVSLQTTRKNLQSMIDSLAKGTRKIYIAKFYTDAVAQDMMNRADIPLVLQTGIIAYYDEMFRSLASSPHVELIEDIWSGVWGQYMSDDIHPDARGYEIMADNYFKVIKPYLQEHNFLK